MDEKNDQVEELDELKFELLYRKIDRLDNREANNIKKLLEKQAKYFSLGSNTLKIERKLRLHKRELNYKEPFELDKSKDRRHRFTREEARAAAKKRWGKKKALK